MPPHAPQPRPSHAGHGTATKSCPNTPRSTSRTMYSSTPRSTSRVNRRGRARSVQRRQHQPTDERRTAGDLRRLPVPDLAHHDHVRVLPQDRAQHAREGQPDLLLHLNLIDPRDLVLHRILHRHDLPAPVVEVHQRGGERRRLARTRRSGNQEQPVGTFDDGPDRRLGLDVEAKWAERSASARSGYSPTGRKVISTASRPPSVFATRSTDTIHLRPVAPDRGTSSLNAAASLNHDGSGPVQPRVGTVVGGSSCCRSRRWHHRRQRHPCAPFPQRRLQQEGNERPLAQRRPDPHDLRQQVGVLRPGLRPTERHHGTRSPTVRDRHVLDLAGQKLRHLEGLAPR